MRTIVYYILLIATCSACGHMRAPHSAAEGDTLSLKYAKMLTVVKFDGYTEVSIKDPWNEGSTLHTYLLIPRTAEEPPHLPAGTVVRVPVQRSVVFNTAHCQLLCDLGVAHAITGVCDAEYILIPELRKRIGEGPAGNRVADCGDGMSPVVEKIISLDVGALLLSPFENSGGYGRLEEIGVPIIECAEYMETSPLGRAEWMRFYGMLYGCEHEADSLFASVDSSYHALTRMVESSQTALSILTERKTGSVWYCPGGRSSLGQLIADAKGKYAFHEDTHSGSLPLSYEQVLDQAGGSDVWAFKYNGDHMMSREDLLAEYHGYTGLKAFRTGEIFECNCSEVPYFEEVSFHPDYLLRELIILLHPDIRGLGELRYYKKLE